MQMEHFFPPISGEDQKKRSSLQIEHFFSPKFRSDANRFKILGGRRCGPFSNYWGDTAKLLGGIYPPHPPPPPGFRHPWINYQVFQISAPYFNATTSTKNCLYWYKLLIKQLRKLLRIWQVLTKFYLILSL